MKRHRHRKMIVVVLLSIATLLLYQNCGQNFKTISAESQNEGFSVELNSQAPTSPANTPVLIPEPNTTPIDIPAETVELKVNNLQGYPGDDFVFEVQLTKALENDIVVNYTTSNLTAKAEEDFIATSGAVTIPKGSLFQKIRIHSLNTRKTLLAKTFSLNLNINYLDKSFTGTALATIRELKLITPQFKSAFSSEYYDSCGLSTENKIFCWERALRMSDPSSKSNLSQLMTPTTPNELFYLRPNWRDDWICYLDTIKDIYCQSPNDQTWSKVILPVKPQQSFTSFFPLGACTSSLTGQSCIQILTTPTVNTVQSPLVTGIIVTPKTEEIVALAAQMGNCRIESNQSASCLGSGSNPHSGNYLKMSSHRFVDFLGQGEIKSVSQTSDFPLTCLLRNDGSSHCHIFSPFNASQPAPGILFKAISSKGFDFNCGITMSDQIICWGRDFEGSFLKNTLLITDKFKPLSLEVSSNPFRGETVGCFLNIDRIIHCFDKKLNVFEMSNFKNSNHEVLKTQILTNSQKICGLTKSQQIICSGTLPTSTLTAVGKNKYTDFVNVWGDYICAITTLGDLECGRNFEMTEFISKNQFGTFLSLKSHLNTFCGLTTTEKLVCMGSFRDYSVVETYRAPSLLTSPENTRVFQTSSLKDFWVGQNFIAYSTKFGSLRWIGSLAFLESQYFPINYLEE